MRQYRKTKQSHAQLRGCFNICIEVLEGESGVELLRKRDRHHLKPAPSVKPSFSFFPFFFSSQSTVQNRDDVGRNSSFHQRTT
mmetsp:Transcript_41496/g.81863  ORF Transcript_41496/g.81863 Transcript_41496/m.81863 type:complete len:83 (+) Transcript_41496:1467-1715(+)